MLKTHHHFFRTLSQVSDALAVAAAWILAYYLRFDWLSMHLPIATDEVALREYVPFTFVLILIWFLSLQISGAYKNWSFAKLGTLIFIVLRASAVAFLIVIAATYFLAREEYSRLVLAIFLGVVVLLLILSRILMWSILTSLRRKGWNQHRVLLIGDHELTGHIKGRMAGRPELGLVAESYLALGKREGVEHIALDVLEHEVRNKSITHVIISLRNEDARMLDHLLSCLVDLNVDIRIVPDVSQYSILGFEVEAFDGMPILTLNQSPIVGWNAVLKRITDIVYASLALIIFSPLLLVISIIIKATSRGPLFYSQERMGLSGRTFKMYKFRSMRVDAESQTGAVWAKKDDDRVTDIGKWLRKTSLDELPQFFNVLKGDMSCVGPRPERPVFVEKFRKEIPGYMLRHKVKAGITGWAQINGFRGNTSLEGRIQHDLYYITHWSLRFDLKIMFLTIFRGFISPHAY